MRAFDPEFVAEARGRALDRIASEMFGIRRKWFETDRRFRRRLRQYWDRRVPERRLLSRPLFRAWRWLLGRDNCETCDGRTCVRGNENVIDGVVMCDDCHARLMPMRHHRLEDR